jgi:hypothetical protein
VIETGGKRQLAGTAETRLAVLPRRFPAKYEAKKHRSGRSPDWLKMKNPNAPAVRREAEEDWAR